MPTPPREMTTVELLAVLIRQRQLPWDYVEAAIGILAERIDGVPTSTVLDLRDIDAPFAPPEARLRSLSLSTARPPR